MRLTSIFAPRAQGQDARDGALHPMNSVDLAGTAWRRRRPE